MTDRPTKACKDVFIFLEGKISLLKFFIPTSSSLSLFYLSGHVDYLSFYVYLYSIYVYIYIYTFFCYWLCC